MRITKFILLTVLIGGLVAFGRSTAKEQAQFEATVGFNLVGSGFSLPTAVTSTGIAGDDRLFVLEKNGRLRILDNGTILEPDFLDVSDLVSTNSERGLLGLAFDPNYAENGYFYINYSDNREETFGDTIVARYTVSADPNVANPESAFTIIEIEQDFQNHNGGWLAFDPNQNLVIGMGDGGSGGDPNNRALSRDTLLGKIIRINVHDGGLPADENGCGRVRNYTIPEDNPRPFGSDDWCAEIWSYGWRNPWRFSFDAQTGDFWAGDVGQNAFEEINFEAAGSTPLQNYGWRCYEGFSEYGPADCTIDPAERTDPVTDYPRDKGTSVTGGYVYRGSSYPDLQGVYLFGDFVTGQLWSLVPDPETDRFIETELQDTSFSLSSFGEGSDDELYLASFGAGEIYQIIGEFGAQIDLSKTALVQTGGAISYTITITNVGLSPLTGAEIQHPIPAGVTYLSGGSVNGNVVTLAVGDLAAGQSVSASWMGQASNTAGVIPNSTLSLSANELSSTITHEQADEPMTIVTDRPVLSTYLPAILR